MIKHRLRIAGSDEATVLKQLDAAIALLNCACRRARSTGFTGLADLKHALMRMRRLRNIIRSHPAKTINWQRVVMAVVWVVEVIREICIILFCHFPRELRSENWVCHKAA